MGEAIEIDLWASHGFRVRARLRLDHFWIAKEGSQCGRSCELGGELTKVEVLALGFNETKDRSVPKCRSSTIAQEDFVAIRKVEQVVQSAANATHHVLYRGLAMAGSKIGRSLGHEGV